MVLDLKIKQVVKGALTEIKKNYGKLTCETIPPEKSSIEKQTFNQNKRAAIGKNFP